MTLFSVPQLSFASVAEHLMFAIVPGGLLLLVFPLTKNRFRSLRNSRQQPTWVAKFFLPIAAATLALQLVATLIWRVASLAADSSFPAAVLSLVTSLSVCAVLQSELANSIQPLELPLYLLGVTALYDCIMARQCLHLGHLYFYRLHCAIAIGKLALNILGHASATPVNDPRGAQNGTPLQSLFKPIQSCLTLLSNTLQTFLGPNSTNVNGNPESDDLFDKFMRLWEKDLTKPNVSITKACIQILQWRHTMYFGIQASAVILNVFRPFMFQYIMAIYQQDILEMTEITLAIFCVSMLMILYNLLEYAAKAYQNRIFASTQTLLMTAIYEKSLRLSSETLAENPPQSSLSGNVDRVVARLRSLHGMLQKLIAVPILLAILYHLIGIACLSAMVPFIIVSILSSHALHQQLPISLQLRQLGEERPRLVGNIIDQLKNIKMMGLGNVLSDYLNRRMAQEIRVAGCSSRYTCRFVSFSSTILTLTPIFVLGTALYVTHSLGSIKANDVIQIFLISHFMGMYITDHDTYGSAWSRGAEAAAALEKFLLLDELGNKSRDGDAAVSESNHEGTVSSHAVQFTDTTIVGADGEVILQAINLEVQRNDIAMVSGPIGCGKTTLLRAILGEIKPACGSVSTAFTVMAYCAQITWIPPLSIREIILAGCPYILHRYRAVLIACCLDTDLMLWPDGDLTSAKSSQFRFTRSLKQRLALARAFYVQSSIIVLDNALSFVERAVSESIMNNLFGSEGLARSWDCTVIMATNSVDQLRYADVIFEINYNHEIWEHQNITSFIDSEPFQEYGDIETNILERDQGNAAIARTFALSSDIYRVAPRTTPTSGTVYDRMEALYYLLEPAQWNFVFLWLLMMAVAVLLEALTPMFSFFILGTGFPSPERFAGLVALGVISVISLATACWVFLLLLNPEVMGTLFSRLVQTTMNATPQFISVMDSSYILELFNYDFSVVRTGVQLTFLQFLCAAFSAVYILALISLSVHYGVFAILFLMVFYAAVQPTYCAARSKVSDFEFQTRVSLSAQFATVEPGIEHIRAFGRVSQAIEEGRHAISESQRAKSYGLQLESRLLLLCAVVETLFLAIVAGLGLAFAKSTSPSAFGFALYHAMTGAETVWLFITRRHDMDKHLACILRIRAFCEETPVEKDDSIPLPPDGQWPAAGELDFHQATITPADDAIIAGQSMKNVSISVEPGEKVGLAGAPDQGQSSVILAVLRMADYTGNISIDGQDIKSISRDLLRSNITTVTEDGMAIAGSVRLNLDPYSVTDDRFSDNDLISMLTRVHLWDIVRRRGGLDADISRMKFSKAHRQLLNLGRGALHKRRAGTRIVLIDEATSSLDADTEFQMSDFMDGEFAGATVLIVAQRLQCFETADTVLMMREGRVDSVLRQDEDTGEWYEDYDQDEPGAGYM